MSKMEITIDEWIVHYISDPQRRKIIFEFLEKVLEKCDKFVTIKGEALDQKIWQMAKESRYWRPEGRALVKWFMANFRQNSGKFRILEGPDIISLPVELECEISRDDLYLIKTAITVNSCILTTDQKLKERMSHRKELTIHVVDEFLSGYDC